MASFGEAYFPENIPFRLDQIFNFDSPLSADFMRLLSFCCVAEGDVSSFNQYVDTKPEVFIDTFQKYSIVLL
jgi:hypothetical protein